MTAPPLPRSSPSMRPVSHSFVPFKQLLVQPVERLAADTPFWGWVVALLGSTWQWLAGDAFTTLLLLIVSVAGCDYYYGTKAAYLNGQFSPQMARRGWHGKMSGIVLLLAVRLFEGWASLAHYVDSRGSVATLLGIALLSVDLQSIAHHREAFGAAPIPVLGPILAWMRTIGPIREPSASPRLDVPQPRAPREEDPHA